jgi:hypothetical protein
MNRPRPPRVNSSTPDQAVIAFLLGHVTDEHRADAPKRWAWVDRFLREHPYPGPRPLDRYCAWRALIPESWAKAGVP